MELATEQHGIVTTRQLRGIGYSRSSASKAAGVGRLHRLQRGVYAVGHRDLSWQSHCLAAVFACVPAVASHTSAAYLWGLLRTSPSAIHLTAPTRRHAKAGYTGHFAVLTDADRDLVEGIPVTSVARTLLDLAAMFTAPRLERMLERAEELRLFDLGPIDELLARAGSHPGRGKLRRALEIYRPAVVFARSDLENRFLALVKKAGLPPPSLNFNVAGFELDTFWERERFAVELDVYETTELAPPSSAIGCGRRT